MLIIVAALAALAVIIVPLVLINRRAKAGKSVKKPLYANLAMFFVMFAVSWQMTLFVIIVLPLAGWGMGSLTRKLKAIDPTASFYQIGETYGSPELISSYVNSGMLDAQFDFNLYEEANSAFNGVSGGTLSRVLSVMQSSLKVYGSHHLMGNISGNHDKPRFMALASGDLVPGEDSHAAGWTREIGITDSAAYDRLALFHAFNMTIPGVPVIYYGDEIGMTGGNDPDCRRMMRFDDQLDKYEEIHH